MTQKNNWKAYKEVIDSHHIDCLYHFTDRENLESIIQNGGLYSWADCEEKGITIAKPGGSGALNIAVGAVVLVSGIASGVLLIVNGARQLAHRGKLIF